MQNESVQSVVQSEVLTKVLISVISTVTLAALSLLFESVRNALFYYRVEYELNYKKNTGLCEWDINWEDYRLTLVVADVSNDKLKGVKFIRNERQTEEEAAVFVSEKFKPLFNKEVFYKIRSIVRKKQEEKCSYSIKLVLRRKRF